MNRSAAVARIHRGLGFRNDQEANIIACLQESQRKLEMGRTLPWFLRVEDATLTLTAGNSVVALPTDFLRPIDDEPMRYSVTGDTRLRYIERKELNQALQTFGSTDARGPEVYALRSNSFFFMPLPDVNYTVTYSYFKRADPLTTDIENAWLANAPEVLIGDAGLTLSYDLRDQDAVKIFTTMRDEAGGALFREIVAREEAARLRRKGQR